MADNKRSEFASQEEMDLAIKNHTVKEVNRVGQAIDAADLGTKQDYESEGEPSIFRIGWAKTKQLYHYVAGNDADREKNKKYASDMWKKYGWSDVAWDAVDVVGAVAFGAAIVGSGGTAASGAAGVAALRQGLKQGVKHMLKSGASKQILGKTVSILKNESWELLKSVGRLSNPLKAKQLLNPKTYWEVLKKSPFLITSGSVVGGSVSLMGQNADLRKTQAQIDRNARLKELAQNNPKLNIVEMLDLARKMKYGDKDMSSKEMGNHAKEVAKQAGFRDTQKLDTGHKTPVERLNIGKKGRPVKPKEQNKSPEVNYDGLLNNGLKTIGDVSSLNVKTQNVAKTKLPKGPIVEPKLG